jgi:hypothetical protein
VIEVDFPGDAEIMRVSLRGDNPDELATLVNAMIDSYMSEVGDSQQTKRLRRIADLEKLLSQAEQSVATKRATLKAIAQRVGTVDSRLALFKQEVMMDEYTTIKKEHTRVAIELLKARARIKAQQAAAQQLPGVVPAAEDVEAVIEADGSIRLQRAKVASLKHTIAEFEAASNNKEYSRLAKTRDGLKSAEQALDARLAEIRPVIAESIRKSALRTYEIAIGETQEELNVLAEQEKALREQVERRSAKVEQFGLDSVELEFLRKELEQSERVYERAITELTDMRLELRAPSRVTVVIRATPPKSKERKRN